LLRGDPPVGAQAPDRRRDIEHAVSNAIAIDDQDNDSRLYLGPARSADLLEVVTVIKDDGTELAIHAMRLRPRYRPLLPGE